MATWDDVQAVVATLPEVEERTSRGGVLEWRVRDRLFTWERPLRSSDRDALGDDAFDGPILAARVPDLGAKQALLADDPEVYFTTPHFDNYPIVLLRLDRIALPELTELLVEAWVDRAPTRLARAYLDEKSQ
jgi:hypothetical protein